MSIMEEAEGLQEILVNHRRHLHGIAEVGFELPETAAYVAECLERMGYRPELVGGSGVVALAGGKKKGKTFLLRADMDALPIQEESGVPFSSRNGNMHACGHDLHTAMLLGAAQLLKNHEQEIEGNVKLMFQPAEEIMSGAKMMIGQGVLENPRVDAAMMIHVQPGAPFKAGTAVVMKNGPVSAACDWFTVKVRGKGCHGAMPQNGVDPLNSIAHIYTALQELNARELSPSDIAVITVGEMHGGNTANVIPDSAYLSGTIRTLDENVREFVKARLREIAVQVARAFRAEAEVIFERGCPCNTIDSNLNRKLKGYMEELLGPAGYADASAAAHMETNFGSEDFAYISTAVPSVMLGLSAGSPADGYCYGLHHPKAVFDEKGLSIGAAAYCFTALEWLKSQGQS